MKEWRKIIAGALLLSASFSLTLLAFSDVRAQQVKSIKCEQLKKMLDDKADIVVVDNQPKEAYDIEHIPGAINFPWVTEVRPPINLPRDKTLVFYCACTHEEDSTDMANQLMKKMGYSKIVVLEGGWLRWQELGYPSAGSAK
jgi:rhodanese-related sulfurtransferase